MRLVTGDRRYGSDLQLPGMLHGAVLRPPSPGYALRAADTSRAAGMPGVTVVREDEFIAVTAPDPATARQVRKRWLAAAAAVSVQATYTTAYLAHVPLETSAALADWDDRGRLTVWAGCNVPFAVRSQLASALGIDEADVRVIVPPTGGGFGGKHGGNAIEAAQLARATGRPTAPAVIRRMAGRRAVTGAM